MQGTGNDYVYINSFEHSIACPSELSKMVSDRHFGIGSDGLILVAPSVTADVRMIMFNADGSKGKCAETESAVLPNMHMNMELPIKNIWR